ncbi:MAG TPA: hypothetical protein VF453_22135, partial [Burkholderiaceae bacterium]
DVWLQRFSRRRAKSPWSKVNRQKAEALIKAGAMQPPGLAEVERAKQDGRWEQAYDSARSSTVPDDLAAALAAGQRKVEAWVARHAVPVDFDRPGDADAFANFNTLAELHDAGPAGDASAG